MKFKKLKIYYTENIFRDESKEEKPLFCEILCKMEIEELLERF